MLNIIFKNLKGLEQITLALSIKKTAGDIKNDDAPFQSLFVAPATIGLCSCYFCVDFSLILVTRHMNLAGIVSTY